MKKPEKRTLYDAASPELKAILDACSAEVEKWEPWQRSLDPLGEKGSYDWA